MEPGVNPSRRRAATFAAVLLLALPLGASRAEDKVRLSGPAGRIEKDLGVRPSLKGLSNLQLIEFMGLGKSDLEEYEKPPEDRRAVPERFWDLPPKDAARAYLEINQRPEDRKRYALILDAGLDSPPGCGTVVLCNFSDKSYTDFRQYYFLRFDPERSYLVYAQTILSGLVGYDDISTRTSYSFLSRELSPRDAVHFSQFVWWLTQARTERTQEGRPDEIFRSFSSADGQGELALTPEDGGRPVVSSGWLTGLPTCLWEGAFGRRARLDSVVYGFEGILFDRLQDASRASSDGTPDERSRLIDLVGSILNLWTPDEAKISSWHASVAAEAAGDLALAQYLPVLAAIQEKLPPPRPTVKERPTKAELEAEFEKLKAVKDPDEYRERFSELEQEVGRGDEPRPASGRTSAEELGRAIGLARRKIASANDVPALIDWAGTRGEGSTWARVRLFEKSPKDLAAILEGWMPQASFSTRADLLYAIFRADPGRALALAAQVPREARGPLRVAGADMLSRAERGAAGPGRSDPLIKIVGDRKANENEVERAVALLVPAEDPNRFPGPAVDDALIVALKNRDGAPDCAARALAWRGRLDQIGPMWSLLEHMTAVNGYDLYERILSAVAFLVRHAGPAEKTRLAGLLRRNFARTDVWLNEFFLSAWSADLRELAPDLARIATSSPAEYESMGGGRYHLARKIVALWSEEDLLAKGKLLIAFGLKEPSIVDLEYLERGDQMRAELGRLAGAATPAQKEALAGFLAWCEANAVGKDSEDDPNKQEAFVRLAREALGLPSR